MSIESQVSQTQKSTVQIQGQVMTADKAIKRFVPSLTQIDKSIHIITEGVQSTAKRVDTLIDQSETIVQIVVPMGGGDVDQTKLIDHIKDLAGQISAEFEAAVDSGWITMDDLFDTHYVPVPETNPQQHTAKFNRLTDRILPSIQEPALEFDGRIVFCAAVDRNGYLPTHNVKFSKRQGPDPAWNSANCRSRRIFNDRVGLRAGLNEEPFLLQVYRREMGGGKFVMMHDLSAPITVRGRHWGGLRMGIGF
ncbi:MAG: hypothetical protein KDK26_07125 [Roseivivax sp.]|nr:hypothetical protein [Roseivivax sp.]